MFRESNFEEVFNIWKEKKEVTFYLYSNYNGVNDIDFQTLYFMNITNVENDEKQFIESFKTKQPKWAKFILVDMDKYENIKSTELKIDNNKLILEFI